MQAKEKKKAIILGVLLAVLVIYWGAGLFGKDKKPAPVSAPASAKKAETPKQAMIKVNTDLLKKPKERYEAARNIFDPVYKKPELGKPKAVPGGGPGGNSGPITVTPLPPLPPPPPPKSPREIAAENAREELKKIKVIGFLKRKDRTDVFMSLNNSNYIVGKGENITKQYFLDQVGKDSILVSDKETGVQVTLAADFSGKNMKNQPAPSPGAGSAPGPATPARPPYGVSRPGYPAAGSPAGRNITVQGGAPVYIPVGGAAVTQPPPAKTPEQSPEPFSANSI